MRVFKIIALSLLGGAAAELISFYGLRPLIALIPTTGFLDVVGYLLLILLVMLQFLIIPLGIIAFIIAALTSKPEIK